VENTLGLEIIEVVEQAAIASARWMGKGEKNTADQVAVEAMRERMNKIYMRVASSLAKESGMMLLCSTSEKKSGSVPAMMPKLSATLMN
jgi:hypothetical protein